MRIGIFVISLERAKRRRQYIQSHLQSLNLNFTVVDAIDGMLVDEDFLYSQADMERVRQSPYWLTKGALACALSHKKALDLFVDSHFDMALILEDDVVLPLSIKTLMSEISEKISEYDIVLLYYAALRGAYLSKVGGINVVSGSLLYPMELKQVSTSSAYIIGKEAARRMSSIIIPVSVAADSWGHFYKHNCYNNVYLHYPMEVQTKDFKSSIEYFDGKFKSKLSSF
ncbi:MAG: glycosyltransferase family 25 protein [Salinivirgaceae bacterium]|nr:glycosyltransferase family 25 protein [Salinivirgaceae bacterium]